MDGPDTDTLLAMVTSLLENTSYDHEVILGALIQCDGDVARAARALNTGKLVQREVSSGQGRTTVGQGPSLDRWLKQTSPGKPPDRIAQRPRPTKRQRSLSPAKPTSASPKIPQLASVVQKPRSASASAPSTCDSVSAAKKSKTVSNTQFMTIFRPPHSTDAGMSKTGPPKFAPLTLTTPEQVAKYTPCTLHTSVLPAELACR